jgi:hypothetical protein
MPDMIVLRDVMANRTTIRTMSRIKPFKHRSISRPRPLGLSLIALSMALGAAIAGANANAAAGPDAAATGPVSSAPWCITQPDGSSTCYETLLMCIIAGIAHAGSCTQRPGLDAPSANEAQQRPPATPRRARVPMHNHSLTAAQREKLFSDFVKWSDRSTGNSR